MQAGCQCAGPHSVSSDNIPAKLGGKYGGAATSATYVAEHAPEGKRVFFTSWNRVCAGGVQGRHLLCPVISDHVALITVVIGTLFVKETKDNDIDASD